MAVETAVSWAAYLTNPFALAGYVLFIIATLATVVQAMNSRQLSGTATERLLTRLIYAGFGLGLVAIVLGFFNPLLQPTPITPPVIPTQEMSEIKNATVAQGGCEASANGAGGAKIERSGNALTHTPPPKNQKMTNVENSVAAQGGCDAVTQGK